MTKQQKIEAWLKGECWADSLVLVMGGLHLRIFNYSDLIKQHKDNLTIVGIYKNNQLINVPDFQDDIEEAVDAPVHVYLKWLDEINCPEQGGAIRNLNDRLLKLEAKR